MKKFLIISITLLGVLLCWPARLFVKRKNCYYFVLENIITKGGTCRFYKSPRWWGYHVSFVKDGYEYHYDLTDEQKKKIKGTPYVYDGVIKKIKLNNNERIEYFNIRQIG